MKSTLRKAVAIGKRWWALSPIRRALSRPVGGKLLADIQQYGWHMITVPADERQPGFTYTVGLSHSYGHPEVIVFGLPSPTAQRILERIADLVQTGAVFADGNQSDEILRGHTCQFRGVLPSHFPAHFGRAGWFYGSWGFPAIQCVWPDQAGRFPWEPECEQVIIRVQAALYSAESLPWET